MSLPSHIRKWKNRLHMLSLLPLSDRALKYFPPSFAVRNPVTAIMERESAADSLIAVMVFRIEEYWALVKSEPLPFAGRVQQQLKEAFLGLLPDYIQDDDAIAVMQYRSDDVVVFVRLESQEAYGRCSLLAGQIKGELENRMRKLLSLHTDAALTFQYGCSMVEDHPDAETAMEAAYMNALSAASRKLPAHFALQHVQLEELIRTENVSVLTQPIMNLKSGEVYGWEILSRGPADTKFHNPAELFEFADQAGMLLELEWLVIRKALREIADQGIREQVFINITPVSLKDQTLLNKLLEFLPKVSIDSKQIVFEITERHSIEDFEQMAGILRAYRSHGFRFAVDDAGAGYSSLQTISELIPDIIKIDKSVIRNIDRESVKQALLRSLLYFAENIDCQVIAEGVEREEEANVLLMNSVHMGQGYYFARPEPHHQGNLLHFETLKEKIVQMRSQFNNAAG